MSGSAVQDCGLNDSFNPNGYEKKKMIDFFVAWRAEINYLLEMEYGYGDSFITSDGTGLALLNTEWS